MEHNSTKFLTLKRGLILFALVFFAIGTQAQNLMQIPPHNGSYTGQVRGYYFQAPEDFVITGLRVPTSASTGDQTVYVGKSQTQPLLYPNTISPPTLEHLFHQSGVSGTGIIQVPDIYIEKGEYVIVLGSRGATVNSYSANVTPYTTSIAGGSTQLHRAGYQGSIIGGNPPNIWSEAAGAISRVELYWDYPKNGQNNASCKNMVPQYPCAGSNSMKVTVANAGLNQIDSFTVDWTIDGVAQSQYVHNTSVIDTIQGTGNSSIQITLGNHSFTNGVYDTIKAWISSVNGVADTANDNDTTFIIKKPSMSGTFTVGAGKDYTTLAAAFSDLESVGVCGPVILDVDAAYTQTNNLSIGSIPGTSSTNTVTVKGNGAKITYSGVYANMACIELDHTEWVIIDNMELVGTSQNYAWGVHFFESNNCVVKNSIIEVPGYYSTNCIPVVFSSYDYGYYGNSSSSNNTLENNEIYGGYFAISMYGNGGTAKDNIIKDNDISGFYVYGMYIYGAYGSQITGNKIHREYFDLGIYTTFYGMYIYYENKNTLIEGNEIFDTYPNGNGSSFYSIGIYINYQYTVSAAEAPRVYNNFIHNIESSSNTTHGIYNYRSPYTKIYNNNVLMDRTNTGSTSNGITTRDYTGTFSPSANEQIYNNNIVLSAANSGSSKMGINVVGGNNTNDPEIDNNNVHRDFSTGSGNLSWGAWHGTPAETVEDFAEANGEMYIDNIEADPQFRDAANGDYEPKDARLSGAGEANAEVTSDYNGDTRGTDPLDIGMVTMDAEFSITSFTLPNASECELHTPEITVTVKNNSGKEYVNVPVGLSVNGTEVVRDVATVTLAAGASANFTYTDSYTFRDAGNYDLKVYPRHDGNNANDTQTFSLTIMPAPRGSELSQAAGFSGIFRSGAKNNFDVTKAGDTVAYEISIPTSGGGPYTDANYSTEWSVPVSVETETGLTVPASSYSVTAPTSTTGVIVKFSPTSAYIDSLLKINIPVRNLDNGCDSTIVRWVFVAPVPFVNFDAPDVCDGDGIGFNNLSTISTGTMTYEWDFGTTPASTTTNTSPVFKYPTFGVYNVKLTAISNWGYSHDTTITVTVYESPNVSFRPVNACEGDAVQFQNNTTVSTGTLTYEWDFGDGSAKDSRENPDHKYPTAGEYTVTLTAEVSGCKRAIKKSAFQFPQPTADFEISGGECNLKEVDFTNTSTLSFGRLGNLWDFGDMNYSTESNTLHTFEDAGVQTITLKVTSEFGCTDNITKQVTLKEAPIADFTNSQTCDIDPVMFTNETFEPSGTNVDYEWTFGDPTSNDNTSNLTNPEHQYSLPGLRTVTLRAIGDNGCEDEISKQIVIGVQPQADFSAVDGCEGEPIKFNNETTISRGDIEVTYEWSFGSTEVSPEHAFTASGPQSVTLTATTVEGGCKDEITKDVMVAVTPSCEFTTTTTGQMDVTFTAEETNPDYDYVWLFGDGGSSSEQTPTWEYTYAKPYEVTLMVTTPEGCGCSNTVFNNQTSTGDINLADRVNIYPNPSNGMFTIEVDGQVSDDLTIEVYNSVGAVVAVVDVTTSVDGKYTVDLGNVAAGVYTVKFTSGTTVYTQKVTVIKN